MVPARAEVVPLTAEHRPEVVQTHYLDWLRRQLTQPWLSALLPSPLVPVPDWSALLTLQDTAPVAPVPAGPVIRITGK